ncbi:MAG: RNA polymerase sigma-70 factor (family 1) [Parvicella sp.]
MTKDQFKYCFDLYFDAIRNYIYFRCGDEDLATDVSQESFMKVWEKNIHFEEKKVKGLLYKIAKDIWISKYRKSKVAEKFQLQYLDPSEDKTPETELEYKELIEKYENTLNILPENQREVFVMSRMEDLSYKEIAERLDLGIKAIEKRMSLALKTLRKELLYEK